MGQNKYAISDYWKRKISQNELFWYGLFDNQPITRDSLIIQIGILNSYTNQAVDGWAVYPDLQSFIGFLKYIYLPTAFIGLIKEDIDNPYFIDEDLASLLIEFKEEYPEKKSLIIKMETYLTELDNLLLDSKELSFQKLNEWTTRFSNDWMENKGVVLSLNLFSSPKEAMNFVINVYEEDLDIDMLERDLGFTKEELISIASDEIYESEFMKRKFTDLLTDRLAFSG